MFVVCGLLFIVRLAFGVGCIEALKYFIIVCDIFLFQIEHKHSKIKFNLQMLLWKGMFMVWRLVFGVVGYFYPLRLCTFAGFA